MRVIQIIDTLRSGGAERMAVNMAYVFSVEGIPNAMVVSRESGSQKRGISANTLIRVFNKKSFLDIKTFFEILSFSRSFKPNVIHAHSTSIFWAVLLKIFLLKTKLIWHDHYGLIDQIEPNDRKLERFLSKWIDGTVVVNQQLRDWNRTFTHVNPKNIILIPNFPVLCRPLISKSSLDYPIIVLQLANLRRQKNHFVSIQAVEKLKNLIDLPVELWLVGNTNLELDYTSSIRKYIDDKKLDKFIKILGESSDIESLLEQSHIGILSSDSEGLPVSLLEYGLAELPVIVTSVGECNVVLAEGKYGSLVPVNDVEAMVSELHQVIENYPQFLTRAKLARIHIEAEYGSKGFLEKYLKFLNSLN